jgi:hypothetical protein
MAEQTNVETEYYRSLPEFVYDAGGTEARAAAAAETASAIRELVRRLAEQAAPQVIVAEVVERVVAAKGKEIEHLVCKQIQTVLRDYRATPPNPPK